MKALTKNLLDWYAKHRVLYPWRKTTQPYRVWLSEVLLQQTRIPVALNFYEKILKRYPNLKALANAKDSDFIALWSGIGYYRRAQNMLACAREITVQHSGRFPSDLSSMIALPGIGKYTAGAIRNICFEKLTPAIDGNIRRVLSRLTKSNTALEKSFISFGKEAPSADFFQSLMELGEHICLPKPLCSRCPVRDDCKARKAGEPEMFPQKQIRKRPEVFHWYLLVMKSNGSCYYLQNPTRSFLKGAWIFPDLLANKTMPVHEITRRFYETWGIQLTDAKEEKILEHAVTFRKIFAHILVPANFKVNGLNGKWIKRQDLDQHPTSSITTKVLQFID